MPRSGVRYLRDETLYVFSRSLRSSDAPDLLVRHPRSLSDHTEGLPFSPGLSNRGGEPFACKSRLGGGLAYCCLLIGHLASV